MKIELSCITMAAAGVFSWVTNQSCLWLIFHMIVAPIYIPYWFIKYTNLCNWIIENWLVK